MATLLETVQSVCGRLVQPVPATVYGSTDKAVVQMMRLLEEGLDFLSGRGAWQQLNFEYTFSTIANADQGVLLTGLGSPVVAPNGLRYILPMTLWDRTNQLPLVGPLDAADWQALQAWLINGPRYQFRLRGGHFLVNPAPTAGWTWAFEYISENFATTAAGVGLKRFTADTNIILLPDQIVQADLRWRWKKEKGLPYAQEFADTEALVVDALARAKPNKDLRLDVNEGYDSPRPTIVVPSGNWRP